MSYTDGTVFKIYVSIDMGRASHPLSIPHEMVNDKFYVGVESYMLRPNVDTGEQRDFWAQNTYIQLVSPQLPPFIDHQIICDTNTHEEKHGPATAFARLPMIASHTLLDDNGTASSAFGAINRYNKDSIMTEIRNNPNALNSGSFTLRVYDDTSVLIPSDYIEWLAFELVVYKPKNKYN